MAENLETFTSTLGGFTIKYPSDWVVEGVKTVDLINKDNGSPNQTSDFIYLHSKYPSRDAITENYMGMELRIVDSGSIADNYLLRNGNNGNIIATLDNGLMLYQQISTFSGKDVAVLALTKNGYSIVDLPNGKKLISLSTFNCAGGDLSNLKLTYDEQLQSVEYKQAIEILKSISF